MLLYDNDYPRTSSLGAMRMEPGLVLPVRSATAMMVTCFLTVLP